MAGRAPLQALMVINSLAGGGAERVFSTLVRQLHSQSQELSITVVLLDEEPHEAYTLPDGVSVVRLDTKGGIVRSIAGLYKLVRRLRPDIALSFLSRANIATIVAMQAVGRPAIVSERVHTSAHLATSRLAFISRFLIRNCYPRAQQVIAVSQGVADGLEEEFAVSRARTCVIYNPVDVAGIRELAAQEPEIAVSSDDFVTMGRLVPNKNTAMAIRALSRSGIAGRLLVLGEGPLRAELEALAQELGLGPRVHFAGFVANPHAILARAGGYLLTSNAEGFPNAMVEAMATGLPVIATDCPSGPAEILGVELDYGDVAWGRGGVLVAMSDDAAMARCMDRFLDPGVREKVSREASDRVEAFSMEHAVEMFRRRIVSTALGGREEACA
ncbi:glycosyltransferase [Novosphingobium panipatense]|uniref:glycosyltransferase n=2 Tax=Novosphingobium TaxID=165696 RepID=UPI000CDAEB23